MAVTCSDICHLSALFLKSLTYNFITSLALQGHKMPRPRP